jgi:hypothetical protein
MSLKSAPYYWLECDGCGVKSTEGSDYAAWADHGQAEDDATAADWYVRNGVHYCDDCETKRVCIECDKPASDLDDDRMFPSCRDGAE